VSAIKRFWRATAAFEEAAADDLLVELAQRGFVRVEDGKPRQTVHLHGLVLAFLKSRVQDEAALNRTLIETYTAAREGSARGRRRVFLPFHRAAPLDGRRCCGGAHIDDDHQP
jgi:hypothetical protein